MNNLYETITTHMSVRKYKEQDIPADDLHKILNCVRHAPTSINGQQCSVIVVRDKSKKEALAKLTGGQEWVAMAPVFLVLVADFSRANKAIKELGKKMEITKSVESTLVGAVDCGIAFGSMMNLAESMGYGIVPIGAIRRKPQEVIDLLKLPEYVYPIVGMCIGVPDEEIKVKPRFDFNTIIHEEEYKEITDSELARYNTEVSEYMEKKTEGQDKRNWSEVMATYYTYIYFPEVYPTMKKQGFENE